MSIMFERTRTIVLLLRLVFRSDAWRTVLALSPVIPLSSGLSYLAGRELIRALPADDAARVTRGAVLFAVAFAGAVWLSRVVRTTRIKLGELAVTEFNRRRVAAMLGPAQIDHMQRPDYLDRLETIRTRTFEVGQVPRMLGWLVDSAGGILVSAGLLVGINPWLGLIVLGGAPPALVNARAQRRIDAVNAQNAASNRRALHLYEVATRAADAKEIRVFRLSGELLDRYRSEWRTASHRLLRAELSAGAVNAVGWILQAAVFAVGVASLVRGVEQRTIDAGDVFVGLGAMAMIVGQFGQAAGGLSNIGRVSRLFTDLAAIEDEVAAQRSVERTSGGRPTPTRLNEGIALRGVSFRYPGATANALSDITLDLPAGGVVAIVGENGAGKSTLVSLLFGLHAPTAGHMLIDGIPLADLDLEEWRRRTSACFQDFVKFELVAREGIGAGDLERTDDRDAVLAAAGRGGSSDIIESLADGLDTQLGTRFGGADLSGGQWQKVAISRAMMRDAPLLLALDEPTGALDPLAEQQIFQSYTTMARRIGQTTGGITVLVSHRFSTVRMADHIVVLDGGRVRETGSHAELVARPDMYAELYEMQARHYR